MSAFFVTCAKGLEALVAGELTALGAAAVEERRAGCAFEGPLALAYRACLWSRTASRVLLPLERFRAPDSDGLYAGVRSIRWREHLTARQTLAVDFTAAAEASITHTHYGALRTKDAIVDQLREETGARPSVDVAHADVRVNVHQLGDETTVSIDLSGDSLHRRGYREPGAPAPLKENLAAAILLLAGWPERARAGQPLIDPMCGSGTLPIEAALIALDRAPGLARERFGFSGWLGHDAAAWQTILDEAHARADAGARNRIDVRGYDVDGRAVHSALGNVERAGLHGRVHIERRPLSVLAPVEDQPPGVVLANPPYGERLGETEELGPLYQELGDLLRRRFPGWTGFVFTGNPELAKRIGLRSARRHVLYNGAIECRLLEFPISAEAPVDEPRWRKPRPPDPAVEMFKNRLTKNLRHLRKWARREDVHCFRAYDADLPEYAVAVDVYEDALHVQEYQPPSTIEPERAERRLADVLAVLPDVCGVSAEDVFLKLRRRQRPVEQYQKLAHSGAEREVREGGHRFLVNLRDYLDTGLFLDHRRVRALIGELAPGRRFLNLFAYTATASVYAARAGAVSSVSVDLSNTYLEWARRNFMLNAIGREHRLERGDCLEWLAAERGRYGLIFAAPPTFSNSKMAETFDVQRDHVPLLRAAGALLEPDGVLLFSNHFRRFKMDAGALPGFSVENITAKTTPLDFARSPRIHNAWRIVRSSG